MLGTKAMSVEFVIRDAHFGKIADLPHSDTRFLKQFISSVVFNHPNDDILLKRLSDVYVLVASIGSDGLRHPGEKSWESIMKPKDYDILKENRHMVIGYMLVTRKDKNTHYIDLFDTVVRGNNLGAVMLDRYETLESLAAIPQEIIPSAAKYWAKVFDLKSIEDAEHFIRISDLDPYDLKWNHLYNFLSS